MAKAIFNVIFKILKTILNIVLLPINTLIVGVFPDFSNMISKFNNVVSTYIGNGLSYFAYMLPSTARNLIVVYLTFLISYYTISYSVHAIIKLFKIIQKIKFW